MKTIKLPIDASDYSSLENDERVYSSAVRFAFNRFQDGVAKKNDVYRKLIATFKLGSHLLNCASHEAEGIYKREGKKKVVFGDMIRRCKSLITKEEYKASRNRGFTAEGEKLQKGNRYFKFDIENNKIFYKRSRKEHITLNLPKLKRNVREELFLVQAAMENRTMPVTVKYKNRNIYITFDEGLVSRKKQAELFSNRILGIDLNPNYIGLSILEFNGKDEFKVMHKEVYDLSLLQKQGKNKAKHELIEINHKIVRLASHYKCSKVAVEDLNMPSHNHRRGREYNRMCNNEWRRSITVPNLKLLCNINGIELVEVNPAYSSFIGNCLYGDETTPDMVASSIEIARRAYKKFSKGWFYPVYDSVAVSQTVNRWKEELFERCSSWVKAYDEVKNLEMRYRVQLDNCQCCFQRIYSKSFLKRFVFPTNTLNTTTLNCI